MIYQIILIGKGHGKPLNASRFQPVNLKTSGGGLDSAVEVLVNKAMKKIMKHVARQIAAVTCNIRRCQNEFSYDRRARSSW